MEKFDNKFGQKELLEEHIESERLLMVPISMQYKEDIFIEFTPEITTFMYPAPVNDISDTEKFIEDSLVKLKNGNDFQLVILKKGSNEFLGCAGLNDINGTKPEIGIWLKKTSHRHGYGKEAVVAMKEWADKNLIYDYLVYPVAEKNTSSRKIPESLGGMIEKEYKKKGLGGNQFYSHTNTPRRQPGDEVSPVSRLPFVVLR